MVILPDCSKNNFLTDEKGRNTACLLPFFYLSINKIQKMLRSVYVAATSQHVGKTTSTLGLVAALSNQGHEVGYCKPVGQQFLDLGQLKVDKDALLFSKVMDFELSSELHSPVILGRGATTAFMDNPNRITE